MKLLIRKTLALIFGGRSSEHEISCLSAANIAGLVDPDEWELLLIGITKDGRWLLAGDIEALKDGSWRESSVRAELSPDACEKCLIVSRSDGGEERIPVDVIFPALHGIYGEDGTIQGLFEMSSIPYVGCGVLASALGMDKFYTKIVVDSIGVRQARYVGIRRAELMDPAALKAGIALIGEELGYPVFVKPSRAGSSVGVSKARDERELGEALTKAAEVDSKILIEEYIEGREVECAVLKSGSDPTLASGVGEILAAAEFYDYDAKYHNSDSRTVTDPDLPPGAEEIIRESAIRIFDALDGYGLARVDFFVREGGEVVFNEINTLPGFTSISMYPMLWEARGINKKELINKLLESAVRRDEI